jgi:AcrR family transcriptional regulator
MQPMQTNQERVDRRVDRTVTALRKALIDLILEKHYDSITVQDIIDRANVGRSTFYTHFRDKEDVLFRDWKRFLDMMVAFIDFEKASSGHFVPIRELMHHLKEFHAFYRALVKSGKSERLFTVGITYLTEQIEPKIKLAVGDRSTEVPPAVAAHYLATQIFATLRWWLDQNMPYSPEEMDKIFHSLVGPGVANALGNKPEIKVRAHGSSIL